MHIQIILDKKLKCAIGLAEAAGDTALAALLTELREKANDLDQKLRSHHIPTLQESAVHSLLHQVEEFATNACDTESVLGTDTQVQSFIEQIDVYL